MISEGTYPINKTKIKKKNLQNAKNGYTFKKSNSVLFSVASFFSGVTSKEKELTFLKKAELANRVDPNEVACIEPPHQGLHCLTSGQIV